MKYDFAQLRIDSPDLIYRGSLVRRFTASIIDILIPGGYLLLVAIPNTHPTLGEAGNGLAGYINGLMFLIIFFLPELFFRKTFGMWVMNLVVIPPVGKQVWESLLIRKFMNMVEFALPSFIYFWVTSLSKNYSSPSDHVSGCIVVREAILNKTVAPKKDVSKLKRVLTALFFSFFTFFLFFCVSILLIIALFGWEIIKQNYLR